MGENRRKYKKAAPKPGKPPHIRKMPLQTKVIILSFAVALVTGTLLSVLLAYVYQQYGFHAYGMVVLSLLLVIGVVCLIMHVAIRKLVVEPVSRLVQMTEDFTMNGQIKVDDSDPITTGDELEALYRAIAETEETVVYEKERQQGYLSAMKSLAYRDELTGVKNLTAYDEKIESLEKEIAGHTARFAVVMVDMNNLKGINDRFGHEKGDVAIKKMCNTICSIFKHSPVFRVGGDEFVVILENTDLDDCDSRIEELAGAAVNRDMKALTPWNEVALSFGVSFYDPKTDHNFKEVFNRADENMYELKRELKAAGEVKSI